MNILTEFRNRFLQEANELQFEKVSENIFSLDNKIFILAIGKENGIITQSKKEALLLLLHNFNKEKVFVSLFENKEDFSDKCEAIAWDSYVWIASEPEHTIHFDSKPNLKPREYYPA